MDAPPYQWRADGGYLGGPPPQQQQQPPAMLFFAAPQPYVQYAQPQILVPGPIGLYGIAAKPQPQSEEQPCPAPKKKVRLPGPPPPQNEDNDKGDAKKDDKPKKSNSRAPPPLTPGTNYMFATEHTRVHIFEKGSKLWEPKYRGRQLAFKIFEVDTQKTVKAMIEYVVGTTPSDGAEKCKGWAATEMIEAGDDDWKKGTTIEYDSDRSKGTMSQMGWNARRGKELPPVWIAIHKV